ALTRWHGARACRRRFARDCALGYALDGWAKTLARGRHRGAFAFVQGLCASGEQTSKGVGDTSFRFAEPMSSSFSNDLFKKQGAFMSALRMFIPIDYFTPQECANFLRHAGYNQT